MIPPRSPYGLLQEDVWPSQWLVLVSCMMLNCTTRRQVERVFPEFVRRWPCPGAFLAADVEEVGDLIRPLGFATRRSARLKAMSESFVGRTWSKASELPGVGAYGEACYEIFCKGNVPVSPPNDHALKLYVEWYNQRVKEHDNEQRR